MKGTVGSENELERSLPGLCQDVNEVTEQAVDLTRPETAELLARTNACLINLDVFDTVTESFDGVVVSRLEAIMSSTRREAARSYKPPVLSPRESFLREYRRNPEAERVYRQYRRTKLA
jgi:hypothetical protein